MIEDRRQQTSRVTEPYDGDLVDGKALDDVVNRDIGGATDKDPLVALDEL